MKSFFQVFKRKLKISKIPGKLISNSFWTFSVGRKMTLNIRYELAQWEKTYACQWDNVYWVPMIPKKKTKKKKTDTYLLVNVFFPRPHPLPRARWALLWPLLPNYQFWVIFIFFNCPLFCRVLYLISIAIEYSWRKVCFLAEIVGKNTFIYF